MVDSSEKETYSATNVRPLDQDPSALTRAAVNAATEQWLRDLNSLREILETRISGMDKAIDVHALVPIEVTGRIERQLAHQKELLVTEIEGVAAQMLAHREFILGAVKSASDVAFERFGAVDTRFLERDKATEQAAQEARISLQAALAAAKEAVALQNAANAEAAAKSELSFTKQIDALYLATTASNKALDDKIIDGNKALNDKIDDLKSRLDTGEGTSVGKVAQTVDSRATMNLGIAIFVAFISFVAILVSIYSIAKR